MQHQDNRDNKNNKRPDKTRHLQATIYTHKLHTSSRQSSRRVVRAVNIPCALSVRAALSLHVIGSNRECERERLEAGLKGEGACTARRHLSDISPVRRQQQVATTWHNARQQHEDNRVSICVPNWNNATAPPEYCQHSECRLPETWTQGVYLSFSLALFLSESERIKGINPIYACHSAVVHLLQNF